MAGHGPQLWSAAFHRKAVCKCGHDDPDPEHLTRRCSDYTDATFDGRIDDEHDRFDDAQRRRQRDFGVRFLPERLQREGRDEVNVNLDEARGHDHDNAVIRTATDGGATDGVGACACIQHSDRGPVSACAGFSAGTDATAYPIQTYALYCTVCDLEAQGHPRAAVATDCYSVMTIAQRLRVPLQVPIDRYFLWNKIAQCRRMSPASSIDSVPSHGKNSDRYKPVNIQEFQARGLSRAADRACSEELRRPEVGVWRR